MSKITLGSVAHGTNICAYCGGTLEGRTYACGGGRVHEECLDRIKEPDSLHAFIAAYPQAAVRFLSEHMSDDFLDEFWKAFREDYETDIERWATS